MISVIHEIIIRSRMGGSYAMIGKIRSMLEASFEGRGLCRIGSLETGGPIRLIIVG